MSDSDSDSDSDSYADGSSFELPSSVLYPFSEEEDEEGNDDEEDDDENTDEDNDNLEEEDDDDDEEEDEDEDEEEEEEEEEDNDNLERDEEESNPELETWVSESEVFNVGPNHGNNNEILLESSPETVTLVSDDSDDDVVLLSMRQVSPQPQSSDNQRHSSSDDVILLGETRVATRSSVRHVENEQQHQQTPLNSISNDVIILNDIGPQGSSNLKRNLSNSSLPMSNTEVEVNCIICSEPFEGEVSKHCMATLKCGHLFGKECIEKWLGPPSQRRCPICSKKAKKSDIIKLYCQMPRQVVDKTERDKATKDALRWESLAKRLKFEIEDWKKSYNLIKAENEELKMKLANSTSKCHTLNAHIQETNRMQQHINSPTSNPLNLPKLNLSFVKNIRLSGLNTRAFHCYYDLMHTLNVCVRTEESRPRLFPYNYGIKSILLEDSYKSGDTVFIHSDIIKGMVAYQGSIITISNDKYMKMTSMINKCTISTFRLNNMPYSVETHPNRPYIYVGCSDSNISVFDHRNTSQEVALLSHPSLEGTPTPVASLTIIKYTQNNENKVGLLAAYFNSCWLHLLSSDPLEAQAAYKLPINGHFLSSSNDVQSGYTLISHRNNSETASHHMLDINNIGDENDFNPQVVKVFHSDSFPPLMCRSKIRTHPLDERSILICASDNSGAKIWDHEKRFTQPILLNESVRDFEFFGGSPCSVNPMLSCLTENSINLYKIH